MQWVKKTDIGIKPNILSEILLSNWGTGLSLKLFWLIQKTYNRDLFQRDSVDTSLICIDAGSENQLAGGASSNGEIEDREAQTFFFNKAGKNVLPLPG